MMQEKKLGSVLAVEEDTQNQKTEEAEEAEAPPTVQEAPTIDLSGVDPKAVRMAEKFGVPVGKIIQWAQYQEARMNRIEEYLQKTLPEDMKKAFTEGLQDTIKAQAQNVPPQTQGGKMGLEYLLRLGAQSGLLGGRGGQDEELQRLTKDIMRANLDRMKKDGEFTDAIKNAIVTKIAGKAAGQIIEP